MSVGNRKIWRVRGLSGVALAFVLAFAFAVAQAQSPVYPTRPVRVVVPVTPGGNVDLIARAVAQKLTESLRQQVVVENRAGASSIIGSEFVARSVPDGYTLLVAPAGTHTINPGLFKKLPYDTVNDFAAVSIIARGPLILVAHPSLPVENLQDLIGLAKAKPGQINAATGGNGTAGHLALEMLMAMSGTRFVQIPYKSNAPGLADTIAGHTSIMIDTMSTSLPQIKTGRLRAIAVTSLERSPLLPAVMSVSEAGLPGYEASVYIGLLAPAGTAREVVTKLSGEVARIARTAETRQQFADQGVELVGSTPEEFTAFIKADIAKWQKVISQAGIKAE